MIKRLLLGILAFAGIALAQITSVPSDGIGGVGSITAGTDNQVPAYSGAGSTLADADCTFTLDGTNVVIQCSTDDIAGFAYNDKDGNVIFTIDTTNNRVCIGCAAPVEALDVAGSIRINNQQSLKVRDTGGTGRNAVTMDGSNNLIIGDSASDVFSGIIFKEGTFEGLRIINGLVSIGNDHVSPLSTLHVFDNTATTGDTKFILREGDTTTLNLFEAQDNAGVVGISFPSSNRINAPGVSVSESYKAGLSIAIGSDTAHDINTLAGIAQSFDLSHDIVFAAQAGKQLDVTWATGATAGMLGMPDLTSAIVLTFDKTANPDTITAGSGTPFVICNDGGTETGTIIIEGGSPNNGTYEVASCTDTVLTLGNGVLNSDETGGSGEYESRYVQPDTWYHVYLIESAGTEDICADTSEIATNCLSEASYDQWRLLQSILTDGTANLVTF